MICSSCSRNHRNMEKWVRKLSKCGYNEPEVMKKTIRISNVQRIVREKKSQRTCKGQCKENSGSRIPDQRKEGFKHR